MAGSIYEPFLDNPPRKRRGRPRKARTLVGKRRSRKSRRSGLGRVGTRHRIVAITKSGGKLVTSPKARIARPSRRINPLGEEALILGANPARRRRRYRKNIAGINLGVSGVEITQLLMNGGTVVAGFIASAYGPKILKISNPWLSIGTKVGLGIGGGMLLQKNVSRNVGLYFATGAISSALLDVVQMFAPQILAGLEEEYDDDDTGYDEMSAFPDEEVAGIDDISAFPDEEIAMGQDPYAEY